MGSFWPGLPFDVHVLETETVGGWSRRLKWYLETLKSPVVINWLDDQLATRQIDTALINAPLQYLLGNRDIGAIYLYAAATPPHIIEPDLPGYGRYLHKQPYYYWTQNAPMLWKRDALIWTCEWAIKHLRIDADRGWVGAYNWELNAGHAIIERDLFVCGPFEESHALVNICNGVAQNKWTAEGLKILHSVGGEPDLTIRGIYASHAGDDVYMDTWRNTKY